jgi:creatinine amidohydrolase/Fe(II)-dependent formamide hydrolase-like protein
MALKPELVKIENLPGDRNEKPLGLQGKDPREFASADIGKKIINMQVERMSKILRETLEKKSSRE